MIEGALGAAPGRLGRGLQLRVVDPCDPKQQVRRDDGAAHVQILPSTSDPWVAQMQDVSACSEP
jgi:hypothetical protein